MFSYVEEHIAGPGLEITFHLTPWDRPIFGGDTVTISELRLHDPAAAAPTFARFKEWCIDNRILLVSCRLAQDRLAACGFLEANGCRFIELNYLPSIRNLGRFNNDPEIDILPALPSDAPEISAFVAEAFTTGRLHADPQIAPEIGKRRYTAWVLNAFENPAQRVLKYLMGGRLIACFVVGLPTIPTSTWSLFCLAPGLAGRGLGQRCFKATLSLHHREGVEQILSSVSSLNAASFNMHLALGFRFPPPLITLHWCPLGPVHHVEPSELSP